jgi:hypothetical protein
MTWLAVAGAGWAGGRRARLALKGRTHLVSPGNGSHFPFLDSSCEGDRRREVEVVGSLTWTVTLASLKAALLQARSPEASPTPVKAAAAR